MKTFYTLILTGIATLLLVTFGTFSDKVSFQLHPNSFVNNMAKYQLFAGGVAALVVISVLRLNKQSKQLLGIGKVHSIAVKEKWLGINGKSSWKINGLQLLVFVSLATGTFMFLGVQYTNSIDNFKWTFMPLVLLFSFTNSLAEELIFRFGIVGGLSNELPKGTVLIISAMLFGVPHYFGFPSGIIGVIMSGILGYILCKATMETKGLSIAWGIHFVQDIIIFTALMMMNVTTEL